MGGISAAVCRDGESAPVILVSADVTPGVKTIDQLQEAVIRAVTKWMKTTDDGRKAWEYSCGDFNIGDLASYVGDGDETTDDHDLSRYMEEEGVKNFRLESLDTTTWAYDDILAISNQLEE